MPTLPSKPGQFQLLVAHLPAREKRCGKERRSTLVCAARIITLRKISSQGRSNALCGIRTTRQALVVDLVGSRLDGANVDVYLGQVRAVNLETEAGAAAVVPTYKTDDSAANGGVQRAGKSEPRYQRGTFLVIRGIEYVIGTSTGIIVSSKTKPAPDDERFDADTALAIIVLP